MSEDIVYAKPQAKKSSWGVASLSVFIPFVIWLGLIVLVNLYMLYITPLGVIFGVLGLPYAIFVIAYSVNKIQALNAMNLDEIQVEPSVQNFSYGTQQKTFLLNIILFVNLVFACIGLSTSNSSYQSPTYFIILVAGIIAIGGAVASLIFNRGLIYDRTVINSEYHAIKTHTGKWKLILVNRILAWFIWLSYGLGGAITVLGFFTSW